MPDRSSLRQEIETRFQLPLGAIVGLSIGTLAILLIALMSYQAQRTREDAVFRFTRALETLEQLQLIESTVKDAETGQRGFLLTGDEQYLDPFVTSKAALGPLTDRLRARLAENGDRGKARIETLARLIDAKLAELEETIALRRGGETARATTVVRSDRGKGVMDEIRTVLSEMRAEERQALAADQQAWADAVAQSSRVTWGGMLLLLAVLAAGAVTLTSSYTALSQQAWIRTGLVGLAERLQGESRLEVLAEQVLTFLTTYLGAPVAALYVSERSGTLKRFASHGLSPDAAPQEVSPGVGLLGQAVRDQRPMHFDQVPPGYLRVASSLGSGQPAHLLVAPAIVDGRVEGAIELGQFRAVRPAEIELLQRSSEMLAVALRTSKDRTRLEDLLGETQRQGEELQTQQEELRVSNEELEEQSRALREASGRLENQQAELEQTNTQLEEQSQLLESQKDDLEHVQAALLERAVELERANQYKNEFLANMSHELRTPLNSSLILAKLLADNKDGNLTDEQVRFSQTILSAGNDLLALINDILDLAKIEAGKVEVVADQVDVAVLVNGLLDTFNAAAADKGLVLSSEIEPGTPERIETDGQRVNQILKNLVSNALKFTARGQVTLRVSAPDPHQVAFAVADTGIGIPLEQQAAVFEAFRQADGTTHRRYGGTGLGLSISRDLARLLGGSIGVRSTVNQGSVFTLTLPVSYTAHAEANGAEPPIRAAAPAEGAAREPASAFPPATPQRLRPSARVDRAPKPPGSRLILVIEDDKSFAMVLDDLARELGFECAAFHTAAEGLAAAQSLQPSAILLDINLPDASGLGVLDELKRTAATRHIPVHVISVADYSQQALERGAVGYALKPVKRDELVEAFRHLESRLTRDVRRVLVVEDDERQRDSIGHLLAAGNVSIAGVATAAEALASLSSETFDCVVMDLSLPDLSGYELLEAMAEQESVSFPPVIVYTGRTLTRDEEQRLRRFSKSIIIKDARSPERLLDEVTLFLHQVESQLPPDRQRMLKVARHRDSLLEGRRILVVEDDVRNIFALSSVLEPKGAKVVIARNGREAIDVLDRARGADAVDLVLMDIMMPEMDGLTAMREIRKRAEWQKLPIVALTAKAMTDDQEKCLAAGASDYIAKPLDVERLLSLVRVWLSR